MVANWLGSAQICVCGKTVHRDLRNNSVVEYGTGWTHKCTFQHRYEDAEMRPTIPDGSPTNAELAEKIDRLADAMQLREADMPEPAFPHRAQFQMEFAS